MIKKCLLFFIGLFSISLPGISYGNDVLLKLGNNIMTNQYLLDSQGNPQPALLKLLQELAIEHDGSLASIVKATQEQWLRKPGSERWHLEEKYAHKKQALLALFNQLGLLHEIAPTQKQYDYCLMLGATAHGMRDRFGYILHCWQQGIRFNNLVFLVSERPLDKQVEPLETITNPMLHALPYKQDWENIMNNTPTPRTEHDIMQLIYTYTALPQDLAAIPTTFINTPMQKKADGTLVRATTGDTIIAWLATKPQPGNCLVISDQPYTGYQDTVMHTFMPTEYPLETVGAAESNPPKTTVFLDTIARWLYQEQQRRNVLK